MLRAGRDSWLARKLRMMETTLSLVTSKKGGMKHGVTVVADVDEYLTSCGEELAYCFIAMEQEHILKLLK